MPRRSSLPRLSLLCLILALTACIPEPEPDYCYRLGIADPYQAWFCEGAAQFPADTLPDDRKDEAKSPVTLTPCFTDSDCATLYPTTNGDPTP